LVLTRADLASLSGKMEPQQEQQTPANPAYEQSNGPDLASQNYYHQQ
jgi:hypothetical protein